MSSPEPTLYHILGVAENATPDRIHRAYRKLALEKHPDLGTGTRAEFDEIRMAHDVLMDPALRAHYDRTGKIREPEADNELAAKLTLVAGAFDEAMKTALRTGFAPEKVDLIEYMLWAIDARQQELASMITEAENTAGMLKPLLGRFAPKISSRENYLDNLVHDKRRIAADMALKMRAEIDVLSAAADLLAGFEYRADPIQVAQPWHPANPFAAQVATFQQELLKRTQGKA